MFKKNFITIFLVSLILLLIGASGYVFYENQQKMLLWQQQNFTKLQNSYVQTYKNIEQSFEKKYADLKAKQELLEKKLAKDHKFDPEIQTIRWIHGSVENAMYVALFSQNFAKARQILEHQGIKIGSLYISDGVNTLYKSALDELEEAKENKEKVLNTIKLLKAKLATLPIKVDISKPKHKKSLYKYYDVSKLSYFTSTEANIFNQQNTLIINQLLQSYVAGDSLVFKRCKELLDEMITLFASKADKKEFDALLMDLQIPAVKLKSLEQLLSFLDNELLKYTNV